jgi:hypothetical protein
MNAFINTNCHSSGAQMPDQFIELPRTDSSMKQIDRHAVHLSRRIWRTVIRMNDLKIHVRRLDIATIAENRFRLQCTDGAYLVDVYAL